MLGISRSEEAIAQALSAGDMPGLSFRCTAVEAFAPAAAFAVIRSAVAGRSGVAPGQVPQGPVSVPLVLPGGCALL